MGTKALPQALLIIRRTQNQCPSKLPRFSTVISHRSSSVNANLLSMNMIASKYNAMVTGRAKRSFIVKSEENSEAETEAIVAIEESEETLNDEVIDAALASETEAKSEAEKEAKPPREPRIKLGDIMGILNKRAVEASEKERPIPDIRTGDIVEIKLEVPENRRRASIYKGIVISRQNAGIHTTIRIRRIIAGIGVEIVFPLYSPNIKEIKVVKHRKVRRARLYYLRDKLPRLSTFK